MKIELIHGDCLVEMQRIPDKSVDMVLCDLPYGTTACKWDVIIPFDKLWEQYRRIIKDNGAIVLFGSEPFSSVLRVSNLGMYKYDWIWDKKTGLGFLDSKFRPLKSHETISVFSIGGCSNGCKIPMKYNPQGVEYKDAKYKTQPTTIFHSKPNRNGGGINLWQIAPKVYCLMGEKKVSIPPKSQLLYLNTLSKPTPTRAILFSTTLWEVAVQVLLA